MPMHSLFADLSRRLPDTAMVETAAYGSKEVEKEEQRESHVGLPTGNRGSPARSGASYASRWCTVQNRLVWLTRQRGCQSGQRSRSLDYRSVRPAQVQTFATLFTGARWPLSSQRCSGVDPRGSRGMGRGSACLYHHGLTRGKDPLCTISSIMLGAGFAHRLCFRLLSHAEVTHGGR
jgi:hypothetical protein